MLTAQQCAAPCFSFSFRLPFSLLCFAAHAQRSGTASAICLSAAAFRQRLPPADATQMPLLLINIEATSRRRDANIDAPGFIIYEAAFDAAALPFRSVSDVTDRDHHCCDERRIFCKNGR